MMNPSSYGPPPVAMMPQQQQQYPPGWPQQQQQQGVSMQQGPGAPLPTSAGTMPPPPSTSMSQTVSAPPHSQGVVNGNYQQQLTTSMSGMSINPLKQQSLPPSANTSGMTPIANGPSQLQQQPGAPTSMMGPQPPTTNNNVYSSTPYTNGLHNAPPKTPMAPSLFPPPTTVPSTAAAAALPPQPQIVPGSHNQMSINSASISGLPHMPPKSTAPSTSFASQMSGQGPPMNIANSMQSPPTTAAAVPAQSQYTPQQQQQPMPPRPGQTGTPVSNANMPPQPGMPPMSGHSGIPPQPGVLRPVGMAGQPGMNLQPGMPPQPGMPLQTGIPPQPGMPLQSNMLQPGMPPQPGMTLQTEMPSQSSMPPLPSANTSAQMQGYAGQQPGYPLQPMPPGAYPQNPMMPPQPGQQRPGFNQPPSGPGGMMYQQPQYQQQPQRRLDPDQMPNPIQVMIENQRNAGGIFVTNQPGLLPPLVTTKFVVQDQGNSSPRFLRSSLYCVPSTADLLKTTALPFTLVVSPFAKIVEGEYEPPIVDFGQLGPIRCNRCKAYMSPNMQFVDAGRRFQCPMCKVTTEVPTEYFQHLDHTGCRVDKYERPELVLGTYEFLATKDYCRNNIPPEIPAFIFIIDVSYNTIKSGLVHLLCSQIKSVLQNLPVDQGQEKSKMRVGFITYNSTVHFYNIKSSLAQPQMMVVGDVQDMFMPLLDGFLCNPDESEALIDALMEQIPKMFVDTKETETILYPAIQAGLEALKASNCTGKLLVFNSSLPIAEAPGKLKNRDDRKLLGTDKEKTVLTPQCTTYSTLGQDCVQNGCSVDLFLFNNSYIDMATIGQVARLTGGEVFKYTYFQADLDGKRLIEDIIKNVSRPIAFDAVMRLRTSAGVRATDFYGHFFMSNATDVELASVDSTKAVAIEIKHDDKLAPEENVYLQIALLYTSCGGQRRLRIFNLALRATTIIAEVFKACDLDAMMLFFAKQACFKLMELTPKAVKENLIHRTAQMLACYRKHCTSPTSAGQLILPECLKLLPLYISCLIKNDAISGGSDMTLDDRSYVLQFVLSMDLNMSVNYFYPRFIPIHNIDPDDGEMPMAIRSTHEKMSESGAYILENGVYLFIWLGQSLPQTFIQPLFGVQCTQQVNAERFAITGDTPLAHRIQNIIETIMAERTRYMRITCVRQNDKLETVFRHFLIEDRGTDGSSSYVDFLCHMHKEIKDLLS